MEHPSRGKGVEGVIRRNPANGKVVINGRVTGLGPQPQTIHWLAAAPVTRGIGFAGSGAPYPNREIAFEGTPHKGTVESTDGSFSIELKDIPAGYYAGLGSTYVPPMVEFISVLKHGAKFASNLWVNDVAVPYRWIAGAPATLRPSVVEEGATGRAMYYSGRDQLPLFENQEALLRARGYPGDLTGRGWPDIEDSKPWSHTPAPA
jgi:hypothetical protein